jgi:hypothetical protein
MTLETNLRGRLRNTSLPASQGLIPLFEAVVNSIHGIEDAGLPRGDGRIHIAVHRTAQGDLTYEGRPGRQPAGEIVGFAITDNGAGFTESNMASFRTLDSDHKADRGGRGVGRLMWLKAFSRVEVVSIFQNADGTQQRRSFEFDADNDISNESVIALPEEQKAETEVALSGFLSRYRKATPKTVESIARSLFEHCLWYFVRPGGAPIITITDGDSKIDLDEVYEDHMHSSAETERCELKGNKFSFTHVKLRATSSRSHSMALCAASRVVTTENLTGRVPGLFGRLRDESGEFVYACYVIAGFLDDHVRPERTSFNLSETAEALFEDHDLSIDDIRSKVVELASAHLAPVLDENKARALERVESFVATRAPRYRPILPRIPEGQLAIDPELPERELELALHRELASMESKLISEGHSLLSPGRAESLEDYKSRISEYLQKAEDIKKSDLAGYVSHRRVIIDLLAKAIERGDDGTYAREDIIHQLIMPMRVDSNEVRPDECNLWLVDERLAFHHYLASDMPISAMPITSSDSRTRPDVVALNVFDNPILASEESGPSMASIVVVELKRPMRNDAKHSRGDDPIEQALDYVERIREGKVTTAAGRPIPGSRDIPAFCYILCDLTPTMIKRCRSHDAIKTADGMGYFRYHQAFHAYIEVSSFDRIVVDAIRRNRAFFDRLGLPAT